MDKEDLVQSVQDKFFFCNTYPGVNKTTINIGMQMYLEMCQPYTYKNNGCDTNYSGSSIRNKGAYVQLISGPLISLLRYKAIIFFDLNFSFSFLGDYELSMEQAQLLSDQTGKPIVPGELVCITCKKHLLNLHPEDTDAPVQTVSEGLECDFPEPITQPQAH